jgi:hypothetical protein
VISFNWLMKPFSASVLFTVCLCLLAGCAEVSNHDLSDGFYIRRAHSGLAWESGGGSQELYYRGTNGKRTRIWEYVAAAYAGKGTAVFIGWREGPDITRGDAYFGVKENGPVVAVSKAVLKCAAQKQNEQPEEYLQKYGEGDYKLAVKDNIVEFEFVAYGVNQPHLFVHLTWDEISEIVDAVTKIGKPHKDKLSGLTYLE